MEELDRFMAEHAGLTFSQIRDLIRDNPEFKARLEALYKRVYHRRLNTGCTNCWIDAFVQLRRTNIETLKNMAKRQFELRAGALLIDVVNHDNAKMASHHNLTDELACYHLRTCPGHITKFSRYPKNWREVVGLDPAPDEKRRQLTEKLESEQAKLEVAQKSGDPARIKKAQARFDKARAALDTFPAGDTGTENPENAVETEGTGTAAE